MTKKIETENYGPTATAIGELVSKGVMSLSDATAAARKIGLPSDVVDSAGALVATEVLNKGESAALSSADSGELSPAEVRVAEIRAGKNTKRVV